MRKAVIAGAAVIVVAGALAAAALAPHPEPEAGPVEAQTQEEASSGEPSPTAPEDVERATVVPLGGIDDAALSALEYELGARYGKTAFEVRELARVGSARNFAALEDGTGRRLDVYWYEETGGWQVYDVAVAETDDDAEIAKQDQVSSLTSRNATFDAEGAIALSSTAKLEAAYGAECASALAGQIPGYLAAKGLGGVTGKDVVVEGKAARAGEKLTFRALVASGTERVVLSCAWDEASSELELEAMP